MSHSHFQTEGGLAARTLTLNQSVSSYPRSSELRDLLARLRLMQPVIDDAVSALRDQNADFDADIAYDLAEQVGEPLSREIEFIETLLGSRPRQRRQREVQA